MKKAILYFVAAAVPFLLASCTKFLTEKPESSMVGDRAYQNESDLEANIRGIIGSFYGDAMYVGNMGENLESASGLIHFARAASLTDTRWQCLLKLYESSTTLNTARYAGMYTGINRCNNLLEGLEASPVNPAFKKEIAAEARFYRAVHYFSLARIYGDVPLRLGKTTSSNLGVARTKYCSVYDQVVADLSDAWEGMRTPERVREATPAQGRPNKWAAKAMLAAVYHQIALILTVPVDDNFYDGAREERLPFFQASDIGKDAAKAWDLAYSTAKDVIDNGPYDLALKYSDLFQWSHDFIDGRGDNAWNNAERIFVLQDTGSGGFLLSRRSLPMYPEGACVKNENYHNRYGNWRPTRFFFQKWASTYPGSMGSGENNSDIYTSSKDPRFNIAMYHSRLTEESILSDGSISTTSFTVYPANAAVVVATQKRVYPYFRKYFSPTFDGAFGEADFYFMRLAELYYIAAEAAARLGKYDEAYNLVEVVHHRARVSTDSETEASAPKWAKGQFASAEELVNAIVWDKLFELCGEGHEYFETHGRGATWFSTQVAKPLNQELKRPTNKAMIETLYSSSGEFQYPDEPSQLRRSLLCEFPYEELAYNPALSGNDKNDFNW